MTEYNWTGSGSLTDPAHWSPQPSPPTPPQIPKAGDDVKFEGGGTLQGSLQVYKASFISGVFGLVGSISMDNSTTIQAGATLQVEAGAHWTTKVSALVNGKIIENGGAVDALTGLDFGVDQGGEYDLKGGSLFVDGRLVIGKTAAAKFVQTGTSTNKTTFLDVLTGSYQLSSGQLTVTGLDVAAAAEIVKGTFTQDGGTHAITQIQQNPALPVDPLGGLEITGGGQYQLKGGTFSTPKIFVGYFGNGTFTQSGGIASVSDRIVIGTDLAGNKSGNGTYTLGGNSSTLLSVQTIFIGSDPGCIGNFNFNTTNNDAAKLLISGAGGVPGLIVGGEGIGTFTQGAGDLVTTLVVGRRSTGDGTYLLQAGTLSSGINNDELIGGEGKGNFVQTGTTTNTVGGRLIIGYEDASDGTYHLDSGTLNVSGDEIIGYDGRAAFDQTNGTQTVNGNLIIGFRDPGGGPGGVRTYTLHGTGGLTVNGEMSLAVSAAARGTFVFNPTNPLVTVAIHGSIGSTAPALTVGEGGVGRLEQQGGDLQINNRGPGPDLVLGLQPRSDGRFILTGGNLDTGSHDQGLVIVGDQGKGEFNQQGGNAIFNGQLVLANTASGVGTFTLDGSTANFFADSSIVGRAGKGSFTASAGKAKFNDDLMLGSLDGSVGALSVTGTNTTLDTIKLEVGNAQPTGASPGQCGEWSYSGGAGTLSVDAGGYVAVATTLTLASKGGNPLPDDIKIGPNGSIEVGGKSGAVAGLMTIDATGVVIGHGKINGKVQNNGLIEAKEGTLTISGDIAGDGKFQIDSNATLEIDGSIAAGTVRFNGGYETALKLDHPELFAGSISGLQQGDTILIPRIALETWLNMPAGTLQGLLSDMIAHTEVVGGQLVLTTPFLNTTRSLSLDGAPAGGAFAVHVVEDDLALSYQTANSGIVTGVNGHPTGNPYVDSLIWGWAKWQPGMTIKYHFGAPGDVKAAETLHGETELLPCKEGTVGAWGNAEQAAYKLALQDYANVCQINFQEVGSVTDANVVFWWEPMRGGVTTLTSARSELPAQVLQGQLWVYFNSLNLYGPNAQATPISFGSMGFYQLHHELGHTLGLAHPHDGGLEPDSSRFPGVVDGNEKQLGANGQNQTIYTTMSYNQGWNGTAAAAAESFGNQGGLGAFDIAALQQLYGTRTYKVGDDSYALPTNNALGTGWFCIWDTGGSNTITNSGSNTAATIDLRAAPLTGRNAGGYISHVDGIQGGFTIANGVSIQNAVGGGGNDTLIGGADAAAKYSFTGGGGNDRIVGASGVNTAIYSGNEANYSRTKAAPGVWIIQDTRAGSPDGTDMLFNVQNLKFADNNVSLPIASAITILPTNGNSALLASQSEQPLTIAGLATQASGQTVSVSFNNVTYTGVVAGDGTWSIDLPVAAISPTVLSDGMYTISASITDQSGNSLKTTEVLNVHQTAPTVLSLLSSPGNSEVGKGEAVDFTLVVNEAVTVTGVPTLQLSDNETAIFDPIATGLLNDPTRLAFKYVVGPGDHSDGLKVTGLNFFHGMIPLGGILDQYGNSLGSSLSGVSGIDTSIAVHAPAVTLVTSTPGSGDAHSGEVITISLVASEGVTITPDAKNNLPSLKLDTGSIATYNINASDPSSGILVFDYTVGPQDKSGNLQVTSVNLNGATVRASSGSGAPLDFSKAVTDLGLQVNTPSVLGITSFAVDGLITAGKTVDILVLLNEAMSVSGSPMLQLNNKASASFADGSGSSTLIFSYKVQPGESITDLQVTGLDLPPGAIIQNQFGASLTGAVAGDLGLQITDTITVVEALAAFASNPAVTQLVVADTSSNVVKDLDSLQAAVSAISTVLLTDSLVPILDLSGSQYSTDASLISRIASPFNLNITLDAGAEKIEAPANGPVDGLGGQDVIVGNGHHNQVTFSLTSTSFVVAKNNSGGVTVGGGSHLPNYQLSDVEFLAFSDKIVFVENADNANIARLYSAALGRSPDIGGLSGWEDIYAENISAVVKAQGVYAALAQTNDGFGTSIAGGFAQSPEFLAKYGALNDAGFVTQLYLNVLDRSPSTAELSAWIGLMQDSGFTRDMVLVGFAESPENIARTAGWLIQV